MPRYLVTYQDIVVADNELDAVIKLFPTRGADMANMRAEELVLVDGDWITKEQKLMREMGSAVRRNRLEVVE